MKVPYTIEHSTLTFFVYQGSTIFTEAFSYIDPDLVHAFARAMKRLYKWVRPSVRSSVPP